MRTVKVKAHELRTKTKSELVTQLGDLKNELSKVKSAAAHDIQHTPHSSSSRHITAQF